MNNLTIRPARAEDAALILGFITELAIYEKAEHSVVATEMDIATSLFAPDATAKALICLREDKPIGYAVYFYNYSTWLGKQGLYLEDLYITPEQRGSGAGKAMLKHLAQQAIENKCGRFEWSVLDWNEPAIQFYDSIGAKPQNEWIGYRLDGEALCKFGRGQ
ncbi:GNAT family N-acetyltransferase [Motiliproteus sp. MSK22-1]|uniref:GNAT family N-acetyltransferase n=1 Tax=Motiliproteus sp. MSK22-1 TaxID=1897630 RepID=UPI000977C4ED|nr:GNAT family N-acetyltransferase [Motiliproteus sp. MSK22-1]OMH25764.1 GNAT family N-acetyltransferase [Motiliproteus sp. MSK22-1]